MTRLSVRLRHVLKEPLLHFLGLGLGLFLLYSVVTPGDVASHRVVVSQAIVDDLVKQYAMKWSGPPDAKQLTALIDSYVYDEILYREGIASGLGRDDPVIKRRICQKIDMMTEDESDHSVPTDAQLQEYLDAHPSKFESPARVSFEQVYFDLQGTDRAGKLGLIKVALTQGANPAEYGQVSLLPRSIHSEDLNLVSRDFGATFAAALKKLPIGVWSGPVKSSLGDHLVRVHAWSPSSVPSLEQSRAAVIREWENDRRLKATSDNYLRLRKDYAVVLEAKLPVPAAQ